MPYLYYAIHNREKSTFTPRSIPCSGEVYEQYQKDLGHVRSDEMEWDRLKNWIEKRGFKFDCWNVVKEVF